jgi:hypothetical protein
MVLIMVYNNRNYWTSSIVRYSKNYPLVFVDLIQWLGLLHKMFTSFSILVSYLCMLYHNFYCIIYCYLPLTMPSLRYLYFCSYSDLGFPSPWTATLTWWEGLCLFDVKKADKRQSEIK